MCAWVWVYMCVHACVRVRVCVRVCEFLFMPWCLVTCTSVSTLAHGHMLGALCVCCLTSLAVGLD